MREIQTPDRKPGALSESRRNTIIRESYDWSQGDKNTGLHQDIAEYVLKKHPEWKDTFSDIRDMRDNKLLLRGVTSRVRGSRHKQLQEGRIPRNHAVVAGLFYNAAAYDAGKSIDEYCRHIINKTLSRDRDYIHGRPEKSKERPLKDHGRKFQSFFCDYFILNMPYPGDPLWQELIQDVQKYLQTARLSTEEKETLRTLIEQHNEWCDNGWSSTKINPDSIPYLK